MLGNGVTRNIVLPTTSGAASWPATIPVENVHDDPEPADVLRVDLVEPAESGRRVVLRGHDPLPVVLLKRGGVGGAAGQRACGVWRSVQPSALAGRNRESQSHGQCSGGPPRRPRSHRL